MRCRNATVRGKRWTTGLAPHLHTNNTLHHEQHEDSHMLWKKGRRSDNVVDARGDDVGGGGGGGGMRFGGGKGLSLTAILLIVGIGWITGQDPMQILGQLTGQMTEQSAPATTQTRKAPPANDEQAEFVRSILGDTEDTWGQIFQQAGRQYKNPTLVLFSNRVNSACGLATSATGPFYCPADQKVYLDMAFFQEMSQRFSAAGDFAQAYVIAHEVGHHVQTLLGVSRKSRPLANKAGRWKALVVYWCARNCRPIAWPGSGP